MNWAFAYARGSVLKSTGLCCGLMISMVIFAMLAIIAKWIVFAQTMKILTLCVLNVIE